MGTGVIIRSGTANGPTFVLRPEQKPLPNQMLRCCWGYRGNQHQLTSNTCSLHGVSGTKKAVLQGKETNKHKHTALLWPSYKHQFLTANLFCLFGKLLLEGSTDHRLGFHLILRGLELLCFSNAHNLPLLSCQSYRLYEIAHPCKASCMGGPAPNGLTVTTILVWHEESGYASWVNARLA